MNRKKYLEKAGPILKKVKRLATKYYNGVGRPLGVTGEIAEYEAIRILHLDPCEARQKGHDAIRKSKNGNENIQIKGRLLQDKKGGRVSKAPKADDVKYIILVVLDENYEPIKIFRADCQIINVELDKPGSESRNKRRQLNVSKFKSCSEEIWNNKNSNIKIKWPSH